ncbi:unnamed protein product [Calypogeia fissa]
MGHISEKKVPKFTRNPRPRHKEKREEVMSNAKGVLATISRDIRKEIRSPPGSKYSNKSDLGFKKHWVASTVVADPVVDIDKASGMFDCQTISSDGEALFEDVVEELSSNSAVCKSTGFRINLATTSSSSEHLGEQQLAPDLDMKGIGDSLPEGIPSSQELCIEGVNAAVQHLQLTKADEMKEDNSKQTDNIMNDEDGDGAIQPHLTLKYPGRIHNSIIPKRSIAGLHIMTLNVGRAKNVTNAQGLVLPSIRSVKRVLEMDKNDSSGPWQREIPLKPDLSKANEGRAVLSNIKVTHDGAQTLSDHVPVTTTLALSDSGQEPKGGKSTYAKLDFKLMQVDHVKEQVVLAWKKEMLLDRDPRVNWEIGWRKIKQVLVRQKKQQILAKPAIEEAKEKLSTIRATIGLTPSAEEVAALYAQEQAVRRMERMEAAKWRLRSRQRWMKLGDAPSKYFFAIQKAKWVRESIKILRTDNGMLIDELEIIREIHHFYRLLYKKDYTVDNNTVARREVLDLVSRFLTDEENARLIRVPDKDEIQTIVDNLPKDKSPGLDGVTVELLRACWGIVGDLLVQVVTSF